MVKFLSSLNSFANTALLQNDEEIMSKEASSTIPSTSKSDISCQHENCNLSDDVIDVIHSPLIKPSNIVVGTPESIEDSYFADEDEPGVVFLDKLEKNEDGEDDKDEEEVKEEEKEISSDDIEETEEDWVDVESDVPLNVPPSLVSTSLSSLQRQKILQHGTLEEFSDLIVSNKAKRILVVAGAGISTASGIPDFRSPKTGLYHNLQKYKLPEPEAIFDIDFFLENPKPFFTLAKELYPTNFTPTLSHFFVKLLADKGLLLKMMTQNIDTLETVAGIPSHLLCEAHGTFATAHCVGCGIEHDTEWLRELIFAEAVPYCSDCGQLVKPDIVFFGESLPKKFFDCLHCEVQLADMVVVMGTSLKVGPFNSIIDRVPPHVPRLLINNVKVGELNHANLGFDFTGTKQKYYRDAFVQGACDDIILKFSELLGWKDELLSLRNEFKLSTKLARVHISSPQSPSSKTPKKNL